MNESQIQSACIDYLRMKGFYAQRVNSGKLLANYTSKGGKSKMRMVHLADRGTPDIMACINSLFVGIEVKAGPEKLQSWAKQVDHFKKTSVLIPSHQASISQYKQHQQIRAAGGITLVVGSVEDLERDLRELGCVL